MYKRRSLYEPVYSYEMITDCKQVARLPLATLEYRTVSYSRVSIQCWTSMQSANNTVSYMKSFPSTNTIFFGREIKLGPCPSDSETPKCAKMARSFILDCFARICQPFGVMQVLLMTLLEMVHMQWPLSSDDSLRSRTIGHDSFFLGRLFTLTFF